MGHAAVLNNYMVVTPGKVLCACDSLVIWDYQVSAKFLFGTSPSRLWFLRGGAEKEREVGEDINVGASRENKLA